MRGLNEPRCRRPFILKILSGGAQATVPQSMFAIGHNWSLGKLTMAQNLAETGGMSEQTYAPPRRSNRVFHRMPVQAEGRSHNGRKFREVCETVVVNAHGALLSMSHEVDDGAILVLFNPATQDEQECRVVFLGEPTEKGQRVGVEFLTPAPRFWGVDFHAEAPAADAVN